MEVSSQNQSSLAALAGGGGGGVAAESAAMGVNRTGNGTLEEGYPGPDLLLMSLDHGYLKYIILVSYMTTFLLGLLGNSLVIYIIAHFSKVRTKSVANYYIWNLAFADELFILVLPLFCYATFTRDWPFGHVCCKVAYAFREINKFGSVFTLVALSVDRYLATCHQLSYLRTLQVGKVVCVGIWVVCAVITTPYILFAGTVPTMHGTSCRIVWPAPHSHFYMQFWVSFQLIVGLIGPLFFICMSYILLVWRLGLRVERRGKPKDRKPGRKLTQTVVVVVVIFLFCQMPYHAVQLVSLAKAAQARAAKAEGIPFEPTKAEVSTFVYFNAVAQILVFVSSCCNPVIYALFNENFRKLYTFVLCKCRREASRAEELRELEVDGKHVPISLKIQVTFHAPCLGSSVSTNKSPTQQTVELENGSEFTPGQAVSAV